MATYAKFQLLGFAKYIKRNEGTSATGNHWSMTRFCVSVMNAGKAKTHSNIEVVVWDDINIEDGDTVSVEGRIEKRKDKNGNFNLQLIANKGGAVITAHAPKNISAPPSDVINEASNFFADVTDAPAPADDSFIPF